jgi:hypothetical protein
MGFPSTTTRYVASGVHESEVYLITGFRMWQIVLHRRSTTCKRRRVVVGYLLLRRPSLNRPVTVLKPNNKDHILLRALNYQWMCQIKIRSICHDLCSINVDTSLEKNLIPPNMIVSTLEFPRLIS